jgi:hypothetical protein
MSQRSVVVKGTVSQRSVVVKGEAYNANNQASLTSLELNFVNFIQIERERGPETEEGNIRFSSYLGANANIRKTGFFAICPCVKAICGSVTATIDEFLTLARVLDEGPLPEGSLARPRDLWFCLTRVLLNHQIVSLSSGK